MFIHSWDVSKFGSFSVLPRDVSQLIFNDLVYSRYLSAYSIEAFRDCALQDMLLKEYPGIKDSWIDVVSSQGSSLLSLDISSSEVTDYSLFLLKNCSSLQALTFDYCDLITEKGFKQISGFQKLTCLGFKNSTALTAEGMQCLSSLVNLVKLDLERCPRIHGGLVHIEGLTRLESLTIRCCKCIVDSDMKSLAGLVNLKQLQTPCVNITDSGVFYLKGLRKLVLLNMEGCHITAACLDYLSDLPSLQYLNLCRSSLKDAGCEKFSTALGNLEVLNIGYNDITDECLTHLQGLTKLESLNLDSCRIGDDGLANLAGLVNLKNLELSDNKIESDGIQHLSGLTNLEDLNLSFTLVTEDGLRNLSGLRSLKSLNLDIRQITDSGLAALTGLTGLTHLDLFGAQITDSGTKYLQCMLSVLLHPITICFERFHRFQCRMKLPFWVQFAFVLEITNLHCFEKKVILSGVGRIHLGKKKSKNGLNTQTSCVEFHKFFMFPLDFKNLHSLDICGGGLTDDGVKNLKHLSSLTVLNLSQNLDLTDKTLEHLSGLTGLVSLNVSNSRITNDGLQHLRPLKSLRSLSLESCSVTAEELKKLQLSALPNLVKFRPEL
ncbi:toll-like receptor 13 isoform X3 [Ipomoea triloba]|uniref:toll-like receptor 13 isoform X3 n=1 Tax=Ipomoea triloba TaxID=35885 RepID=UPI00125E4738|nr:toll-like receptor 13 isoform X3 [Ipomoea triloba]XP_031108759.1 toll-like receptor 13 isoform X3 [Ipomoea triloba]